MRDGRGYVRHTKVLHGTKAEGDRYLAAMRVKWGESHACPTVGEAWDAWVLPELEAMERAYREDPKPGTRGTHTTMKTSTMKQHLSTWKVHVAPRWADVRASDVRYSDVQAWLDGMTLSVAKHALAVLRLVMKWCVRNDCLDANVAAQDYRMPKAGRVYDHGAWPLDDLNEKVWPAVWGRACEAAFILSAFDGARTGECLAPRLDEVRRLDVSGVAFAVVPFSRQVLNEGAVSADGDLKNKWSPRATVLPEPWSLRLLQLADEAAARGEAWLSDRGDGRPMSQQAVRRDFRRALKEAGIEALQWRALRRSWRSWVATKGISHEVLEKMMGHSDGSTTSRYYLEMDEKALAEELARAFDWKSINVGWDILGHK